MKFKRFLSIFLALVMALGLLTVQASKAEADIQGTGGKLVHQGVYTGRKGNVTAYLSDLYGTEQVKYAHSNIDAAPFTKDKSFQGDGSKAYPIYLWNADHTVNVVNPEIHPDGRELVTLAEGTHTFMGNDIVLGYQGVLFEKGLGGHLIDSTGEEYDGNPSAIVFDISGIEASKFYAVAGLTGDAANKPTTLVEGTNDYGVTFAVYGSSATEYADNMEFTLISSVDGIGGYADTTANSKVYNTAEFDLDISGYNFLKLEAVTDGNAGGGSYAWGDACLYEPLSAKAAVTRPENLTGKDAEAIADSVHYLSDLYNTDALSSSFVIGASSKVASPRQYAVDKNFDSTLYIFTGASGSSRLGINSSNSPRVCTITNPDSSTSDVTYLRTDIALGYRGTKYEKGLGGLASPGHCKPASIVYDLQGLNAERFYAVGGITGTGNTNDSANNGRELCFSVYGSKSGTNKNDFELLAYTKNVHAYLTAEFDLDISGYRYLKLEVACSSTSNSGKSFAWGDACVYRVTPEETPVPTEISTVSVTAAADLTLNVGATADDTMTAPKMRFSGIGETTTVEGTKSGDTWQFSFPGIYSQHMTDTLTMELLDDSDQVADTRTYSIAQYFDSLYELGQTPEGLTSMGLTAEKFGKLATLLADILEYGAAAQVYVDYNTANPANSAAWVSGAKSGEPSAPASDTALSTAISADDRFTSANLRLANFIRISVAFKASAADRIIISNGQESTTVMLSDLTPSGGKYTYITPGLNATAFDTVYTFTLSDGTETYQTLNYSVNSYVASKFNDSTAKLASLVKAICNYGASADNYAN